QDTRTALGVLKAKGLDEGGATRLMSVGQWVVRGLTLNMVDYDARGGFRVGSGPVPWQFGKFAKAISDSTGRQALDEQKLALLRHTDAELEAMPEDRAQKIREFKSQLATQLADAFGGGEMGQAKAAQVMDVLTGKARKDAVERLHVLTNADRMAVRQRDDLDKHLDDARSMGNEWAYTSTMELVRNLEDVGLKARQASLEKMSYAFKENALNRSDLSNVIYRSFIGGKLQHEIREERDDTYIAETRGYDRRAAAVAFADLTDTALNRSRFQDRGGALAKQMKDAQDQLKELDSILLTGARSRAIFGTDMEGAGWAKKTAVTAFNIFMNKNEELIETGTPGKPEKDFATDLAKKRDLQLD
ncbi:hypothetical protein EBR57_10945, partial [bacterium]|nr:hypothetical protein [bacterium]